MKLKDGVDLLGMAPQMAVVLVAAETAFQQIGGVDAVVTSCCEGKHSMGSLHYKGLALDFRISHVTPEKVAAIYGVLKANLGESFDVVLESDHIHVEWDQKVRLP